MEEPNNLENNEAHSNNSDGNENRLPRPVPPTYSSPYS